MEITEDDVLIKVVSLVGSLQHAKCPRCWHYTKDGLNNYDNLCDRCVKILCDNFSDHVSVHHIRNKTAQQLEYWEKICEDLKESLDESLIYQRVCDILPKDFQENPQYFLGINYKTVFNFWKYLDSLTPEDWKIIDSKYSDLDLEIISKKDIQICKDIHNAAWWASFESVEKSVSDLSLKGAKRAACLATGELIRMPKKRAEMPMFLPLFLLK